MDEAHVGFCDEMPFLESNSIDLAVSNNVLEHVANPDTFLSEINRVLKPGGKYIVKTPNIYHYIIVLSRITPDWFHVFFNKLRGRPSEDTFPTLYKINCKKDLYDYAHKNGFSVEEYHPFEARPEYLRVFFPLYIMGIVYERIINFLNISSMKIIYYAVLKKEKHIKPN
ncbi:MAG: methyltransferase domain-containing protein [Chloroflexia bacterium]|nr:methyltransferase domain-containing protein [Chloroflexia bacterium]